MPAMIKSKHELLNWLSRMKVGYNLDVFGRVEDLFPRPHVLSQIPDDYLSPTERGLKFFRDHGIQVEFHTDILNPNEFTIKKVPLAQ